MKKQDLREKFVNAESRYFEEALIEKCVQIAKDYAEKECILFAVWLNQNAIPSSSKDGWWIYKSHWHTTDELYQLFKNRENER